MSFSAATTSATELMSREEKAAALKERNFMVDLRSKAVIQVKETDAMMFETWIDRQNPLF
jgi:hypothetical protein